MLREPKRNYSLAKCSKKYYGKVRESVKLRLWNVKGTQEKQFSYQVWLNIPRESKRVCQIREMEY